MRRSERHERCLLRQLKAATEFPFGIDRKYERIPGLILVFRHGVRRDDHTIFALSYDDPMAIAGELGWTATG